MVRNGCFYCHSNKIARVFPLREHQLAVCAGCGLTYTLLPREHNVSDFNDEQYSLDYLTSYEARKKHLQKRFIKQVHEIETRKQGGKLLDVGCSTGMFLEVMSQNARYHWKLTGIDINKRSIAFARKHHKAGSYMVGSVLENSLIPNNFDVVTCFDILEHDPSLPESLRAIHSLLKPGGLLVVQSPNYKSIMALLCGDNWDWWSLPDHIMHFTPNTMMYVLTDNGFSVDLFATWEPREEFVMNVIGTIRQKVPKVLSIHKILSKLAVPFVNALYFFIVLLEKLFPVGGLMVGIARKS